MARAASQTYNLESTHQVLEHLPQAEHVTSGSRDGRRIVGQQFRGNKARRAMTVRDGHGATRHLPCVPSVEYNHATTSVECDVAGLDVQMQEACFVPCFDRLAGHTSRTLRALAHMFTRRRVVASCDPCSAGRTLMTTSSSE